MAVKVRHAPRDCACGHDLSGNDDGLLESVIGGFELAAWDKQWQVSSRSARGRACAHSMLQMTVHTLVDRAAAYSRVGGFRSLGLGRIVCSCKPTKI